MTSTKTEAAAPVAETLAISTPTRFSKPSSAAAAAEAGECPVASSFNLAAREDTVTTADTVITGEISTFPSHLDKDVIMRQRDSQQIDVDSDYEVSILMNVRVW